MNAKNRKKVLETIEALLIKMPNDFDMMYVSIDTDKVVSDDRYKKTSKWGLIVTTGDEDYCMLEDTDKTTSAEYSVYEGRN